MTSRPPLPLVPPPTRSDRAATSMTLTRLPALRPQARLEERRTNDELHRQQLALEVEHALIAMGTMSAAETAGMVQQLALGLLARAQEHAATARGALDPEHLAYYQRFAHASTMAGLANLIALQSLGQANILEILSSVPDFRDLPRPQRRLLARLFGGGDDR